VKRARELIYTAERQASRDVGLAGLRLKPGSSHLNLFLYLFNAGETYQLISSALSLICSNSPNLTLLWS
jgi:hypothetical protein